MFILPYWNGWRGFPCKHEANVPSVVLWIAGDAQRLKVDGVEEVVGGQRRWRATKWSRELTYFFSEVVGFSLSRSVNLQKAFVSFSMKRALPFSLSIGRDHHYCQWDQNAASWGVTLRSMENRLCDSLDRSAAAVFTPGSEGAGNGSCEMYTHTLLNESKCGTINGYIDRTNLNAKSYLNKE